MLRFSALCGPNEQKFGELLTWPKVTTPSKFLPNLSTDSWETQHLKGKKYKPKFEFRTLSIYQRSASALADNKPPNQWVIKSIEFAQAAKTDCCLELGQWQIGSAFLESEVGRVAVVVGHHRSLVRLLARSMRGSRRRMLSMVGELQFNRKAKLERICGNASPRFPRRTFEHESRRIPLSFNAGLQAAGTETHYVFATPPIVQMALFWDFVYVDDD